MMSSRFLFVISTEFPRQKNIDKNKVGLVHRFQRCMYTEFNMEEHE